MESRILQLIAALRASGVRVSLAESAEAFSAVDLMGIQDREQFRLSLRATLIKDVKDIPTFEKLFPLFFGSGQPPMMGGNPTDDLTPEEIQMLAEALRQFAENLRQRMERLMNGEQLIKVGVGSAGSVGRIESGGESRLSKLDGTAHDARDGIPRSPKGDEGIDGAARADGHEPRAHRADPKYDPAEYAGHAGTDRSVCGRTHCREFERATARRKTSTI